MNTRRYLTALFVATGLVQNVHSDAGHVVQITQIVEVVKGVPQHPTSVIEDLGDIRPLADKSLLKRMRLTASVSTEYVSNALYSGNHGSGDFLLRPSISGALDHPMEHGFSLSLNARTESFIYSKFDESSFWGFSGSVFLNYQPTNDSLRFYAGIEPSWYASLRTGDQLSEALGISGGVAKDWAFNRDRTVFFVGYHFSHYFSFPTADDRNSHRVTLGVTHQLRPSFYGQLYYSFQYSDYTRAARDDSRNLVGLNFVYQVGIHWSGNLTTYLVDNDSTIARATYQAFGIGIGAAYRF